MVDLKNKEISPFLMVIFGGSGDLTLKKVIPSLFELYIRKLLPSSFYIVSIARSDYNTNSYRDKVKLSLQNSINNKIENHLSNVKKIKIKYDNGKYCFFKLSTSNGVFYKIYDKNIDNLIKGLPFLVCFHQFLVS